MDVELGKVTSKADAAEDSTVDWRGRPSDPDSHGGARAAAFVLGLQAFEIMAIAAVGNNLITYVINEMHLPLAKSANVVTNFVGTIFLLSLFGGFLSDSYLGSFWTMLVFGFIELSGFILLSVQAHLPQLKPPKCDALLSGGACEEAKGIETVIFYVALYLVALGSGCVKPNMISHGADQFAGRPGGGQLSTYFNAAYFAFSVGELVALTLLVWAQTHFGMDVGFGISAAAMAVGLICLVSGAVVYRNKRPRGSIFTPIAQVIVAAISKRKQVSPSDAKMLHGSQIVHSSTNNSNSLIHTDRFRWLDKACIKPTTTGGGSSDEGPWRLCTVNQVEQVKTLISLLPIFASTIIFNTILAQLQTFSVQQASVMNTRLSNSFSCGRGARGYRDGFFRNSTANGEYPGSSSAGPSSGAGMGQMRKAPPVENTLACSLEEIYKGTRKKMKISRTIMDTHGKVRTVEEILSIEIKPGWKKGTKVTFPEKGNQEPGVIPSDIIFVIDEKPHPIYKRDGNDLIINQDITLLDALTGKNLEFTSLDGRNLVIPLTDIIKPGYEMVVPNEGMPISKDPRRKGNLKIKFDVNYPSRLTEEQKADLRRVLGGNP